MSLKNIKTLGFLFLIFYFFAGLLSHSLSDGSGKTEPIFSWFLFYKVPAAERVDYKMLIRKIEEEEFDPPIFFEEAKGAFTSNFYMHRYNHLFRELGKSIQNKEDDKINYYIRQLERKAIKKPIVYEISRVEYNLIEKWKNKSWKSKEVLGVFKIND